MSVGRSEFRLAWYRELHHIPNDTYYRHLNSLIEQSFITRVGRDKYKLHWMLFKKLEQIVETPSENVSEQQKALWDTIPF